MIGSRILKETDATLLTVCKEGDLSAWVLREALKGEGAVSSNGLALEPSQEAPGESPL